jgi:hypothetical protein
MNTIDTLNVYGIEYLAQNNINTNHIPSKNCYVLNYQQVPTNKQSEFNKTHPVIRECRNLVVRETSSGWIVLSRSFRRFFNWKETKESDIIEENIPTGKVRAYEKKDGSLISVTYFDNAWHIFTRSCDADDNPMKREQLSKPVTYGECVRSLLDLNKLNTKYTYVFELCTELGHITKYDSVHLSLLTIIDKTTNHELDHDTIQELDVWNKIETFIPTSVTDLDSRIKSKPVDFEGYVLKYNNIRVKYKSDTYVTLHRLRPATASFADFIKAAIENEIDELKLIASMKPYLSQIDKAATLIESEFTQAQQLWDLHEDKSRKAFAIAIIESKTALANILFAMKDGKITNIRCPWLDKPDDKDYYVEKICLAIEKKYR